MLGFEWVYESFWLQVEANKLVMSRFLVEQLIDNEP